MIRLLLFLCCILIGAEFLEEYSGMEEMTFNLDWLPIVQRIVISITALIIVITEYLKIKSFNITMLVFLLVLLIYNPFKYFEVSTITKVASIVLFFMQALKARNNTRFNQL